MERSYHIEQCLEESGYRYRLDVRTNAQGGERIVVVQLNPSVATWQRSDPTVGKVSFWAANEGITNVSFVNLFAYRTPHREALGSLSYEVAVGPLNDRITAEAITGSEKIILAWGRPIDSIRSSFDRRVIELSHLVQGQATFCVGAPTGAIFPRHGRMWNSPNRELRPYSLN